VVRGCWFCVVLVAGFYGFVGLLVLRFNPWFVAAGFYGFFAASFLLSWFLFYP
jgi:hypothetical protein